MPNANEKLTITLTGRQPVKITKEDWPIIASAEEKKFDGQYDFQANRTAAWKLIVRQHHLGKTVVYAIHSYNSSFQGEEGRDYRGGVLIEVPDADAESIGEAELIVKAIEQVAADIEARLPEGEYSTGVFPRLAHECIADLPAVEI